MTDNLQFAVEAAWKVLALGLLLGAGLPLVFALGVRSLRGGPAAPRRSRSTRSHTRRAGRRPSPASPSSWPGSRSA